MPFWVRAVLIVSGSVALFFGLAEALVAGGLSRESAFLASGVAFVIGCNGLLYLALRCPKCGKWACRLPSGYATVWPGFRCRYCQQSY